MSPAADPRAYRSEAFAEDLLELQGEGERHGSVRPRAWLIHLLPAAVALLAVAFAVVPPMA